jgi:hypothetical protein
MTSAGIFRTSRFLPCPRARHGPIGALVRADAMVSMLKLGELQSAQGKDGQGEALLLEAMETGRRTLGERHPVVLEAMAELANVYLNLSQPKCGEEHFRKVLELRIGTFGTAHQATIQAMNGLAEPYGK